MKASEIRGTLPSTTDMLAFLMRKADAGGRLTEWEAGWVRDVERQWKGQGWVSKDQFELLRKLYNREA